MKFGSILTVFTAAAATTQAMPNVEAREEAGIARRQGLVSTILDQAVTLVDEVVADLKGVGPDLKTDVGLLEEVLADLGKAIKDLV